jgi:hypothetical protein
MKMIWLPVTLAMIVVTSAGPVVAQEPKPDQSAKKWTFDSDTLDKSPAGFSFGRTGSGAAGRWVVRAEKDAPSGGQVLAQVDTDATDYRFLVAAGDSPSLKDLRLSVKCKPISGEVDQACGLVFRYKDENNYYLTRANALEDNVRIYHVKDGKRQQFASFSGKVTGRTWHELRVDAKGDHFEVYWDGKRVLDAKDQTFSDPGRVGVWTKADSVTYFDDLSVSPLP